MSNPAMVNSSSKRPLYQQLKEELRVKIEQNEFTYGQKIPSEPQLMAEYGMSRVTVRRALEELSKEGYLLKIQGKGTFVDKPKVRRKIENVQSFTKACEICGMKASHRLVERSLIKPTKEQRNTLSLDPNDRVIYTSRILLADEQPVMLEHCFFPYNQEFAFIMKEDLERSLYTILGRYGKLPSGSSETTLEAVGASFETAEILNVPVGEPMFYIAAVLTDQAGRPLYIEHSYIVGSRYMYRVR